MSKPRVGVGAPFIYQLVNYIIYIKEINIILSPNISPELLGLFLFFYSPTSKLRI